MKNSDKDVFDEKKKAESPLTIIVATSDHALGETIHHTLSQEGHTVHVFEEGKEALRQIEEFPPHIVLLDHTTLPQFNGLTVLNWVKLTHPDTAVVLMGEDDALDLAIGLTKAGIYYVKKPFDVNILSVMCKGFSQSTLSSQKVKLEPDVLEYYDQMREELVLLKESEESFRMLVDASGDIIFRVTPQGIIKFASPAVKEQLGYAQEDLREERVNVAKFVYPEDLIRVMAGIRQVIQGTSVRGLECRFMHQGTNTPIWYSLNCYPLYDSDHQFSGAGGIAREIDSIKTFERQIRKQNEQLSTLNEIAGIVSQTLDLDDILQRVIAKMLELMMFHAGGIFLINPTTQHWMMKSFRVDIESVQDKNELFKKCNLHTILPDTLSDTHEAVVIEDISQHAQLSGTFLAKKGFRTLVAIPLQSKETMLGVAVLLSQKRRVIPDDDVQLLLSIGQQVGMTIENIQYYQRETEARTRLEELNKLKDDFVSIVSHDLRSPLTAILGSAEVLLSDEFMEPPLTEDQKEFVKNIQNMGALQLQLVNDLLDLAKIESGKIELYPTMADIYDVAGECYDTLQVLAQNKNITMDFISQSDLPKTRMDIPKIHQVINNLVTNAIKFTEPGGKIILYIDVEDEKFLKVSVYDTGTGIAEEHLPSLFDKFQQVRMHGTQGERGSGLGLAICKNLIDLHHGKIWAESQEGVGSTFIFTLPIIKPVILIIDDSLFIVRSLQKKILTHLENVTVLSANNGLEGLQRVEETLPTVIILDYMMPDMDGIMVFQELQDRYGNRVPPTIFLTASTDLEVRHRIFELGAADYLQKPVDIRDLLPRLRRFL